VSLLAQDGGEDAGKPATVFNHNSRESWWVGGQMNFIFQANPSLPAHYSGPNSFGPDAAQALSRVLTLYAAARLSPTTDVIVHLESAGGSGLSNGAGLGGATDLDVVRNPRLRGSVYVARAIVRHVFPLGAKSGATDAGPFSVVPALPDRRLAVSVGKFSLVDVFDLNSVASDVHLQFMNYAIDNTGSYDYAADTRGYTFGAVVEYHVPRWTLRFAECLMPTTANGPALDWHVARAHSENAELEMHRGLILGRDGRLRLLGFVNHANMGAYADAITAFQSGLVPQPDITRTEKPGTIKYGSSVNIEQAVRRGVRGFMRAGWNDGHTETFAYTEMDRTFAVGADSSAHWWHRPSDKLGGAVVMNGLSATHRAYLGLGGRGFQLGDGGLSYGRETILETYYTVPIVRGVFASVDVQRVANPGFNRSRGPLLVSSIRWHVDF
jgi:hypothetical protein